ncbi:MAG: outer membrane beta-barrel domain-containing protein [Bdellovibrionaceae bacterium]|nr:outer membrane beta-barrel domain-containing protein [Pseudobdellovibrionaceae bacterium]
MFQQARTPRFSISTSILPTFIFAVAAVVLSYAPQALAQSGAKKAAPVAPAPSQEEPGAENKSDKLDVTDLEKKYWAAKDTDFSVVQNRTYAKAGRYALSASYGVLVNDPYSDGTNLSASLNYYFSERFGAELNYTTTSADDNKAVEAFQNLPGAGGIRPDHGKIKSFYGAAFNWVPFYAKMSIQNVKIVYFDMAISPGLGVTTYEQQVDTGNFTKTSPTLTLDVTQSFFLSKHFAFRFDYKNRWFQEKVLGYSNVNRGREIRTETNQTSILLFGATFFY